MSCLHLSIAVSAFLKLSLPHRIQKTPFHTVTLFFLSLYCLSCGGVPPEGRATGPASRESEGRRTLKPDTSVLPAGLRRSLANLLALGDTHTCSLTPPALPSLFLEVTASFFFSLYLSLAYVFYFSFPCVPRGFVFVYITTVHVLGRLF